ncbi:MAG: PadR family transcriptional regulator [Actinobacteria bacterium]|nr:PadR family transcriptional regulator [Actinomycetota bacterium]
MQSTDIATSWVRGTLETCLLALLARGEAYGYQLTQELAQRGIGQIPGGSLYPALARLEKAELITSQWRPGVSGPGRKYYRLTGQGRQALAAHSQSWREFAANVQELLSSGAEVSDDA